MVLNFFFELILEPFFTHDNNLLTHENLFVNHRSCLDYLRLASSHVSHSLRLLSAVHSPSIGLFIAPATIWVLRMRNPCSSATIPWLTPLRLQLQHPLLMQRPSTLACPRRNQRWISKQPPLGPAIVRAHAVYFSPYFRR